MTRANTIHCHSCDYLYSQCKHLWSPWLVNNVTVPTQFGSSSAHVWLSLSPTHTFTAREYVSWWVEVFGYSVSEEVNKGFHGVDIPYALARAAEIPYKETHAVSVMRYLGLGCLILSKALHNCLAMWQNFLLSCTCYCKLPIEVDSIKGNSISSGFWLGGRGKEAKGSKCWKWEKGIYYAPTSFATFAGECSSLHL